MSISNGSKALSLVISISAIAVTSIAFQTFRRHGLKGTLRYVWIGDHLPPNVRVSTDMLVIIETKQIPKIFQKLYKVEVLIDTATLNSVDDGNANKEVNEKENRYAVYSQVPSLQKDLGALSYRLDQLAADIDSIESHGDNTVRLKKKELSTVIVDLMKTVDVLITNCGFDEL